MGFLPSKLFTTLLSKKKHCILFYTTRSGQKHIKI